MPKKTVIEAPKFTIPGPKATPGEIADARVLLDNAIKEQNAKLKELEEFKSALDERIRETAKALGGSVFGGKLGSVVVETKDKLVVDTAGDGWTKLYKWITKTGNFDCLQRRLGEKAVQDRLDAGEKIPGITTFPVETVKVKK